MIVRRFLRDGAISASIAETAEFSSTPGRYTDNNRANASACCVESLLIVSLHGFILSAKLSTSTLTLFASTATNVAFRSYRSASASPGSVVAPYPMRHVTGSDKVVKRGGSTDLTTCPAQRPSDGTTPDPEAPARR